MSRFLLVKERKMNQSTSSMFCYLFVTVVRIGTVIYHSPDVLSYKTSSSVPTTLSAYSTASTPTTQAFLDRSTLTDGGIAGIVLGAVTVIAVCLAIAFLVFRRLSTHKKEKSKNDPGDTEKPTSDDLAYTNKTSTSSPERKIWINSLLSYDSENDMIQRQYPAVKEIISDEECEDTTQPLLTNHSTEHQVCDDEEERASKKSESCNESPVESSYAKSHDLEFTEEQDKKEFSGDIYKTFPLYRPLPRDSGYLSGEWDTRYPVDQCSSPSKVKDSSAGFDTLLNKLEGVTAAQ